GAVVTTLSTVTSPATPNGAPTSTTPVQGSVSSSNTGQVQTVVTVGTPTVTTTSSTTYGWISTIGATGSSSTNTTNVTTTSNSATVCSPALYTSKRPTHKVTANGTTANGNSVAPSTNGTNYTVRISGRNVIVHDRTTVTTYFQTANSTTVTYYKRSDVATT